MRPVATAFHSTQVGLDRRGISFKAYGNVPLCIFHFWIDLIQLLYHAWIQWRVEAMAKRTYELFQLRCFVAVAEELNFRRAAERLHMTQPPLSRQIRLLEESIGLQLLERNNRQARLTPAGRSFFQSATDILRRSEQAVLNARQAQRGEAGSIALGFVPSAGLDLLPRIVVASLEQMPDLSLNTIEMMHYEIVEGQRTGRVDLGLTRSRAERPEWEKILAVSEPLVLAVPADHPLAAREDVRIKDLDNIAFIAHSPERGGIIRETQETIFAIYGISPRIVHEASQAHTTIALVSRGVGLGMVPSSARAVRMPNVKFFDLNLPRQYHSELHLVYPAQRPSLLRDRLIALILDVLADFRD